MNGKPPDHSPGIESRLEETVDIHGALEQVLSASNVELWYLDRELRVVGCNQPAREVLQALGEPLPGEAEERPIFEAVVGWDDPERRSQECRTVMDSGRPLLRSIESCRRGAEVHTLSVDKIALADPQGESHGLLLVVTDLTAKDQSHEARRESEERFRLLTTNLPGTVYLCRNDERWSMLYLGRQVANLTGYSRDEFLNDEISFVDLYHPDDAEAIWPAVEQALETQKPFQLVYRLRHRDGGWRWVEEQGTGVFRQGELIYLQGFLYDISARKEAEAERERLIVELEQKNAELERFTYTVSHELKSPLVTIQGFVGLLREDLAAAHVDPSSMDPSDMDPSSMDQVTDHLDTIAGAAGVMGELLQELLELSRVGKIIGERSRVSLQDLIDSALERLAGDLKRCPLEVTVMPDAPPLFGDRGRLIEVIQNLIENAIKYRGDGTATVRISAHEEEDRVVVSVRDQGIGVAPEHVEKIFGLFYQLNPKRRGSGVGLAIVRRIIELHGGRIWVESDGADQGSTFLFSLPVGE